MSAPIPDDPRGNYCVMILMHTEDAAKALTHPECVRMAVAAALETHSLPLQEEVDFTIDVYRTECDKDVTTHRIAALEAQVQQLREALELAFKGLVAARDVLRMYGGDKMPTQDALIDMVAAALAATEKK